MLKYIGDGRHITGIPAQDLTDEEITRLAGVFDSSEADFIALLIERGLYSQPKTTPKMKQTTKNIKDTTDGIRSESISLDTD